MAKLHKGSFRHLVGATAVMALVLAPVAASAATDTQGTTINATVGSTITMTTSGTLAFTVTPGASATESVYDDVVTISTNNAAGYTLALSDSDATNSLQKGGDSIAAHTGTTASPTALATNSWGFRVDNSDGAGTEFPLDGFGAGPTADTPSSTSSTGSFAAVPVLASPVTVRSTTATAASQVTNVWYGVRVDASKPNGVYTGAITYTATTK